MQISYTILSQCISICLYNIEHITKAIICLKLKFIYHALQGDNLYIEKGQFMRNSIDCKDQIFWLSVNN